LALVKELGRTAEGALGEGEAPPLFSTLNHNARIESVSIPKALKGGI
jgi:hypothetical protein